MAITDKGNLRAMIDQPGLIVAPGCHDALGARIAEELGFEAVYMAGNATSAASTGRPDIGLLGMSEMIARARCMVTAVDVPVICDADTGYGGVDNVARTVREYEAAGVSAIHIEDQVIPKKCGAMAGIGIVPIEEAVTRVRAAVTAKSNPNFIVIARTDARAAVSFDEALDRVNAFAAAGADMVIVEDLQSREEVEQVPKEAPDVPLMFDVLEAWPWTNIPLQEIEQLGYKLVIYCLSATLAYAKAVKCVLQSIIDVGHTMDIAQDLMDLDEYEEILGLSNIERNRLRLSAEARTVLNKL